MTGKRFFFKVTKISEVLINYKTEMGHSIQTEQLSFSNLSL